MTMMKKWLALLMAMLLLLTLCACGEQPAEKQEEPKVTTTTTQKKKDVLTDETLQGDWTMKLNISALMQNDMLGNPAEGISGLDFAALDVTAELDTTFKDGKMTVDHDDVATLYKNIVDAIINWISEGNNLYEMLAADEDMSPEEYKAALDAEGYTKEFLLSMILEELPDADEMVADMDSEIGDICYELDGDKLYTWDAENGEEKDSENYMLFSYDGNTIIITKGMENGTAVEFEKGDFVFVRK